TLVDTDDTPATADTLAAMLSQRLAAEPQLALREGTAHIPRLTPSSALTPPAAPAWKLVSTGRGDLTKLALVETDSSSPLGPGRFVVAGGGPGLSSGGGVGGLGAIADAEGGGEAAGVVIDTAADVTSVRPGQAVMGLFPDAFATTAVTDQRAVVAVPPGWSFA